MRYPIAQHICLLVRSVLKILQLFRTAAAIATFIIIWSLLPVQIEASVIEKQELIKDTSQTEVNQLLKAALHEQDPVRGLRIALRVVLSSYRSQEKAKVKDSYLEITDSLQFVVNSLSPPFGKHIWDKPSSRIQAAAFSPNGNILSIWETPSPKYEHGRLKVLKTDPIREVDAISLKRQIRGQTLTTSSYNKRKRKRFIPLYNLDPGWVTVALSPDGKWLALGGWDASVSLWNVQSQNLLGILATSKGTVWDIAFSHGGDVLATASADSTITLWDLKTGNEFRTLSGDDIIASASWDNTIKVWDASSGKELYTLSGHTRPVNSVAYNHNGTKIVSGSSDGTVKVWDMKTTKLLLTLRDHQRSVRDVAFSPDGSRIASASTDKTAIIWDANTGEKRLTLEGHQQTVWSVGFAHDGTQLITASSDGSAIVWDTRTGKKKLTLGGRVESAINEAIFTSTDKYIVTIGDSAACRWWKKETGKEEFRLGGRGFSKIAMSPNGSKLAVVGYGSIIGLFDTVTPKARVIELEGPPEGVAQIVFSPDGDLLAVAGKEGTVKLWETASGKVVLTLERTAEALGAIAFSPEGFRMAAADSADNPKIWDVAWSIEKVLKSGHAIETRDDNQGILNIWQRDDTEFGGEKIKTHDVTLSPFGELVATAGADNRIRVWSVRTGILILSIFVPKQNIRWLSFGPNGHYLFAVGDHGKTWYYKTQNLYHRDLRAVMAMGFERLGKKMLGKGQHHLYLGIAQALRSDYQGAIKQFQKVPENSSEWGDANKLIRQLLSLRFTASDVADILKE
jgi:WD40 repeat protein